MNQQTNKKALEPGQEEELYIEPAQLARRDIVGVILALVALTVIGVAGYIWLTPGMSLAKLATGEGKKASQVAQTSTTPSVPAETVPAETMTEDAQSTAGSEQAGISQPLEQENGNTSESVTVGTPASAPSDGASPSITHTSHPDGDLKCPYCGMFPARSETHVIAQWADGAHHHYDCFDCMFSHAKEAGAEITRVMVADYNSELAEPAWLEASNAMFLYDTERVKGSMPPYVAAFATHEEALAAQAELKGEMLDWAALQAKWESQ